MVNIREDGEILILSVGGTGNNIKCRKLLSSKLV